MTVHKNDGDSNHALCFDHPLTVDVYVSSDK